MASVGGKGGVPVRVHLADLSFQGSHARYTYLVWEYAGSGKLDGYPAARYAMWLDRRGAKLVS